MSNILLIRDIDFTTINQLTRNKLLSAVRKYKKGTNLDRCRIFHLYVADPDIEARNVFHCRKLRGFTQAAALCTDDIGSSQDFTQSSILLATLHPVAGHQIATL
eukprot:g8529.t1